MNPQLNICFQWQINKFQQSQTWTLTNKTFKHQYFPPQTLQTQIQGSFSWHVLPFSEQTETLSYKGPIKFIQQSSRYSKPKRTVKINQGMIWLLNGLLFEPLEFKSFFFKDTCWLNEVCWNAKVLFFGRQFFP